MPLSRSSRPCSCLPLSSRIVIRTIASTIARRVGAGSVGDCRYASIIGSGVRAESVGDRRYASIIAGRIGAGSATAACISASRTSANSAGRVPTVDVATRGAIRGAASARTVSTVRWVSQIWNTATQQVHRTVSEQEELAEARAMGLDSEHLALIQQSLYNHRRKSRALR